MPRLRTRRRTNASRGLRMEYLKSQPFVPRPVRQRASSQSSNDAAASLATAIPVIVTERRQQPTIIHMDISTCVLPGPKSTSIGIGTSTTGSDLNISMPHSSFSSRVSRCFRRSLSIPAITINPPTPPLEKREIEAATQDPDLLVSNNCRPQSSSKYKLPMSPILEEEEPSSSSALSSSSVSFSTSLSSGTISSDTPSPGGHASPSEAIVRFCSGQPSGSHNIAHMPGENEGNPLFILAAIDWDELSPTSLGLREGDIVQVLGPYEDGWCEGMRKGARGWFPAWAVEEISVPLQMQDRDMGWANDEDLPGLDNPSRSASLEGAAWNDGETSSSAFSPTSSALASSSDSSSLWGSFATAASFGSSGYSGSVSSIRSSDSSSLASMSSLLISFGRSTSTATSDASSTSDSSNSPTDSLRSSRESATTDSSNTREPSSLEVVPSEQDEIVGSGDLSRKTRPA